MDWENQKDRITQIEDWYDSARSEDAEWRDRAEEAYDFYFGDTWTGEEVAVLDEKSAPHLSINKIQPRINLVSAIERSNRYDLVVKARTDPNDVNIAQILTHLMRNINTDNRQGWVEAQVFLDGIISGRGWWAGDISYEKNMFGDIVSRYINPFCVKFDPTSIMPDLSDAQFIMEEQWYSLEDIERVWGLNPEKNKEDAEKVGTIIGNVSSDSHDTDYFTSTSARDSMGHQKVIECWHRHWEDRPFLVDVTTGDLKPIKSVEEGYDLARRNPGKFYQITMHRPRLMVTVICNGAELTHADSPFSSPIYPLFGFFCLFVGGRQEGLVQSMKDPQMEINKRRSNILHLTNQHNNTVWVMDENALKEGPDWLRANANKPGLVIVKRPGTQIGREHPSDIPQGLVYLDQQSSADLFDVSGMNPEVMPTSSMGSAGSGRAIALRQAQGMQSMSLPTDNLRMTRFNWGSWILRTIQEYYTTERVIRYEGEDNKDAFATLNKQALGTVLYDVTLGQYDVTISDEPMSPSNRVAMFNAIMEMLHQGVPIPPDLLIELSDIPGKDRVIQRMRETAQQQEGAQGSGGGQGGKRRQKISP